MTLSPVITVVAFCAQFYARLYCLSRCLQIHYVIQINSSIYLQWFLVYPDSVLNYSLRAYPVRDTSWIVYPPNSRRWFKVGPASKTVAQHQTNFASTSCLGRWWMGVKSWKNAVWCVSIKRVPGTALDWPWFFFLDWWWNVSLPWR